MSIHQKQNLFHTKNGGENLSAVFMFIFQSDSDTGFPLLSHLSLSFAQK